MVKVKITQIKSVIDRPKRQKATMKALGMTRINRSKELEGTPQVLGMIHKVKHLLRVEHLK